MSEFLIAYFSIGIGFYLGLSVKNPEGFVNASAAGIIRGIIIGLIFWPIGLIMSIVLILIKELK